MHWFLFLSPTYFYGDIDAIAGFLACKASGFRLSADNLLCRRAPRRRRRQVYIVHLGLRFLCVAAQSPAPIPGTAPPITHVAFHSEPGTKERSATRGGHSRMPRCAGRRFWHPRNTSPALNGAVTKWKGRRKVWGKHGQGQRAPAAISTRLASTATNVLAEYLPTAAVPRRDCGLRIAGACYDIIDPTTTTTSSPSSSPSSSSSSARTLDFGGLCARLGACGATAGCARSPRLVRVLARKPLSGSGIRRRHPPPLAGGRLAQSAGGFAANT